THGWLPSLAGSAPDRPASRNVARSTETVVRAWASAITGSAAWPASRLALHTTLGSRCSLPIRLLPLVDRGSAHRGAQAGRPRRAGDEVRQPAVAQLAGLPHRVGGRRTGPQLALAGAPGGLPAADGRRRERRVRPDPG